MASARRPTMPPTSCACETRAAVACGLGMLEEIERINEDWKDMGRPHIAIGVGIHTGEATCGVVGAPGRLEVLR